MTIPLEHTPGTGIAITRHQCELCKTCWTIHLNKQTLEYTEGVIKKDNLEKLAVYLTQSAKSIECSMDYFAKF